MKKAVLIILLAILPAFVTGQQPVKVQLYTPDSSVKFAAADLATVPEEERPYIRYLSLYNIPQADRPKVGEIVSFLVNSMGTRRRMYIPLFVGDGEQTVIRININNYEWEPGAWDSLATNGSGPKKQPEPYFNVYIDQVTASTTPKKVIKSVTKTRQVQQVIQGRLYLVEETYTEQIEVDAQVSSDVVTKKIFSTAPWLDKAAIEYLKKYTTSDMPIMRADWFIVNASMAPAYYDFLRLGKTQKDFEKLIFADEAKAKLARSQDKGVVVTSGVARNNRTLLRSPTFTGGYYWVSHDSKSSTNDRQYVQNILHEKFDATEDIGTLPNGLQAYFLTDGTGKRLDFADSDIAVDNSAHDRVVRSARSCIVCHSSGILPIDDEIRALTKKLQNKDEVKLLIAKKEDAYRIDDLFGSDLDEQIVKDQNLYAAAVGRANGLRPDVNAKQFQAIFNGYYEYLLDKETVARELALPPAELEKYIRISNDPVVLGLIRTPIRSVRRDQWERSYQAMMLLVNAHRNGQVPIIIK